MPEKAKDLWFTWTFEDGRIAGAMASATEADADVTVTLGYADFLSMAQGALDLNAAFMQGRAKATGSTVALLELVPVTSGRPFKALLASLSPACA